MKDTIRVELTKAQLIAVTPIARALDAYPYNNRNDLFEVAVTYWSVNGAVINNSWRPIPRRFPVHMTRRLAASMLKLARATIADESDIPLRGREAGPVATVRAARAAEKSLSDALTF